MIRYAFDLYPRTDPLGARLVRFTKLLTAWYRGEANGSGSGKCSMRATDAEADFLDPEGLQYVRVVRIDDSIVDGATLSGFDELVVGGFFTESGQFDVLTKTGTKLLTWGGAGPLNYLQRAVMDADSWIDDPFIGTDPQPDGTWPLHLAGTGNELGAILWRILHELEEPGRHQNPLPAMSLGFTHLLDSNGSPWVRTTGDFVAQVADPVLLPNVKRLMEMGLYVEVDVDTFEVRAYEPETHRRDRTGASWGASVVRFQAPTGGDISTGNIKSNLTRALEAKVRRNAILTGSNDTWLWVLDPSVTVPWEGGKIIDDEAGTSLEDAGQAELAARGDAGDTARLRMMLGNDPLNGRYKPFESDGVLLDDIVTLHTGVGTWDYNEAEFPVAALTISLRPGGDWDCWVDLGSTFLSMQERAFQAQPVAHHTHPPNPQLCRPATGTPPILRSSGVGQDSGISLTIPSGLADGALFIAVALGPFGVGLPANVYWSIGATNYSATLVDSDATATVGIALYRLLNPVAGSGNVTASSKWLGAWLLEGVNQTTPVSTYDFVSGTGTVTALSIAQPAGTAVLDAAHFFDEDFVSDAGPFTITATGGQISDGSTTHQYGSPGYSDQLFGAGHGDASPGWTGDASRPWMALVLAVNGSVSTPGDGHVDLIGTSVRAKRCDDTEHYHTTADPTVNDDTTLGFRNKTLWFNESGGKVKTWLLKSNADGAAVWLLVASTSHADMADHATGDPHPQYVREAEFAAAGDSLVGTGAGTLVKRKHNESATTAPTVNDDSGDGYAIGSHWIDTTADKEYIALDVTVGAAVWKERTATGGGGSLTVKEVDGTPSVSSVTEIKVSNGTLTDNGSGSVTVVTGGGGGALTHTYVGYNTVGGTDETMVQHRHYMKKITLASDGTLVAVEAHIKTTSDLAITRFRFCIFEDNAGTPRYLLDATDSGPVFLKPSGGVEAFRWFGSSFGRHLPAGDYWIGVATPTASQAVIKRDGSGSDRYFTAAGDWSLDAGYNTITTTTDRYSIRASILT